MYKFTSTFLIMVGALTMPLTAASQQKLPSRAEVDAILENAARQSNSQLSNTKVDDDTTLTATTYDKATPLFAYHYRTLVTKRLGRKTLTASEKEAMWSFHHQKTCSSHFKALMIAYGLQVAHIFEDGTTGKNLLTLTYRASDCKN